MKIPEAMWAAAASLDELSMFSPGPRSESIDRGRGDMRLAAWRRYLSGGDGTVFSRRLQMAGITETSLRELLGESPEAAAVRAVAEPTWFQAFREAYASGRWVSRPALSLAASTPDMAGLLRLVGPLIHRSRTLLQADLVRIRTAWPAGPVFDPVALEAMLYAPVAEALLVRLSRTLTLELHIARLRSELCGETSADRFAAFIERLDDPSFAVEMFTRYPVLARQATELLESWRAANAEMVDRLCRDWPELKRTLLAGSRATAVTAIKAGAGDFHQGGKSVGIIELDQGEKVVYKPRSVAVEQHFQELLAWVNEQEGTLGLRLTRMLTRPNYGWVEFIKQKPCSTHVEIRRYYERTGGLLALLWALQGTDFHHENLRADGEHPVLIDLECLFHPRLHGTTSLAPIQIAAFARSSSVLFTGLLPERRVGGGSGGPMDVSGLGANETQRAPLLVRRWVNQGTDEMRMAHAPGGFDGEDSRPVLGGAKQDPDAFADDIIRGFTVMCRLLLRSRRELLGKTGLLSVFAGDEVRVLLRRSQSYFRLLLESFHPDVLRGALDRDRHFDRLWVSVELAPWLEPAIPAEQRDLRNGDIPRFTTRPGASDLHSGAGDVIADFLPETAFDQVYERLTHLSEADVQRQVWTIRASLATLRGRHTAPPVLGRTPGQPEDPSARMRAQALATGERLAVLAIRNQRYATWYGISEGETGGGIDPAGMDLYAGIPGIALFLAHLADCTGANPMRELGNLATNSIQDLVTSVGGELPGIGFFEGAGGVLYALAQLTRLLDRPELLSTGELMLTALSEQIETDEDWDVVGGAAGAIVGLLAWHGIAPESTALRLARRCGQRLVTAAQSQAVGIAWPSTFPESRPLIGMSHGTAGIALALRRLAIESCDVRFDEAARGALAYERSTFDPHRANWPDFRRDPSRTSVGADLPGFQVTWCHGAPGIGLARLGSGPVADSETLAEVRAAVRTTLSSGFTTTGSHCLCHGALGNLDLLLTAGSLLPDHEWRPGFEQSLAGVLDDIDERGIRCANPLDLESPGLMTGLAGVGYQLLRLAHPDRVPSLLAMEPTADAWTPAAAR